MLYTSRTIKVSIPYIQQAMASKVEFEAAAFCLLVKLNVTSSVIHNATYRRLKEITHMGSDKLKRLVDYCTEHGMIYMQNGAMHICKMCQDGRTIYKFKIKHFKRKGKELRFFLTLANVKDMMRRAVVASHIKQVENIRQTNLLTIHPNSLKDYRKGRRLLKRLAVWGFDFFISNRRLANIANCCISKVQKIKSSMIQSRELERTYSNTLVCEQANEFNIAAYQSYCDDTNFLFEHNGKIYKHNPNVYNYIGNNIVFVPKNNK